MNKKGFTLVELLAVIALVAILSGIAVPNILSTINNSKKSAFLMDAKRMVAKAEYLISLNKADRQEIDLNGSKTYTFANLNEKGEFQKDADDGSFDASTFVKVKKNSSSYVYCICVKGSRRTIGTGGNCNSSNGSGCIESKYLTGIDKVLDN